MDLTWEAEERLIQLLKAQKAKQIDFSHCAVSLRVLMMEFSLIRAHGIPFVWSNAVLTPGDANSGEPKGDAFMAQGALVTLLHPSIV